MPLLQGTLTHTERDPGDVTAAPPRPAFFMDHPTVPGRYVLGDSVEGVSAFLKAAPIASALGRFVLDDDPDEDDRTLYLTSATRVLV